MGIRRVLITMMLSVGLLLVGTSGLAESPGLWLSAGVKGAIGGNRITEASDKDIYAPDFDQEVLLPFMDGAGGTGGGGGIFGEVRILRQYLGLEIDVLFDANKTWYVVEASRGVKMNYILRYATLRMPLLLKVNLKTGPTRFGFGIGPEFRLGLGASTDVEATENEENITTDELSAIKSSMFIKKRNDIGLAWGVALAFETKRLDITLDLRFSHALSWPREYDNRVKIETPNQDVFYTYQSGHSVDGRIMLGVAYVIKR